MMLCVVEIFFFVNFILFQSVGCSWPWSQSSSDLTLQKLRITSNLPEYTRMSEDCLTVNVFTNANCLRNGGCAVVYMIHGGEYNFDSPMLFPIDFLVDNFTPENRSVIFVSVTYRLGSFGFLNISPKLKSSAIKNVGLLDMIEGLRWVQKEISNLGGDPKRVTLMGHSSGAVNAQQLTVSPLTKGLFHQAIIMSGSLGIPIPPSEWISAQMFLRNFR
ncbi:unnamed protein product [Anisakis simplex]|uniref:COesterase domain-containing protein n=1 Tax=Anisakis simplex TaxID=6269 RepID=A0A0M3KF01_ANISI|nr:unnamed protein product [Anisakis simplex]